MPRLLIEKPSTAKLALDRSQPNRTGCTIPIWAPAHCARLVLSTAAKKRCAALPAVLSCRGAVLGQRGATGCSKHSRATAIGEALPIVQELLIAAPAAPLTKPPGFKRAGMAVAIGHRVILRWTSAAERKRSLHPHRVEILPAQCRQMVRMLINLLWAAQAQAATCTAQLKAASEAWLAGYQPASR